MSTSISYRIHTTLLVLILLVGVAIVAMLASRAFGGPLDPPGAPGPTMKTLQEVEPRTPISSLPYTISAPGSYYLTGNLSSVGDGILITPGTNNITIDLQGFTITGARIVSTFGIFAGFASDPDSKNVTVRNGTVTNFSSGVFLVNALYSTVEAVQSSTNVSTGIAVAAHSTVRDCIVHSNTSGIVAFGADVIVDGCVVSGNTFDGITMGSGLLTRSTAEGNGRDGIVGYTTATIRGNTMRGNGRHGIFISDGSAVIEDNTSSGNGTTGEGYGISAGIGSRVEGNHVEANDYGIVATAATKNVIIRNTARNNTIAEYLIDSGNYAGAIVTTEAALNAAANSNVNVDQ